MLRRFIDCNLTPTLTLPLLGRGNSSEPNLLKRCSTSTPSTCTGEGWDGGQNNIYNEVFHV